MGSGAIPMTVETVRPAASQRGSASKPEARWVLRDGTRDLHDRAEKALGDGATRRIESYVGMLRANLAMTESVRLAVEAHVPRWLTAGLDRDRARLCSDLADLGAAARPCASSLAISDRAGALGAIYVCEGARLGGRVLARQVEERLGMTAHHGASYLDGEGAGAGPRWQSFVATVNRELARPEDLDQALHAARTIFSLIIQSYEEA